nr:PREDICTED: programmed cell death protein 4-like [Lepisosteus oculatus]
MAALSGGKELILLLLLMLTTLYSFIKQGQGGGDKGPRRPAEKPHRSGKAALRALSRAPTPRECADSSQSSGKGARSCKRGVLSHVGGAGGKGVWGAAGMVYEMEEPDARDPNYDESSQLQTCFQMAGNPNSCQSCWSETRGCIHCLCFPECTGGEDMEQQQSCFLLLQALLKELNLGPNKYEFSSLAVVLALEGKASHRELMSRLLSDLVGRVLSEDDMARAFDKMLTDLPDLILDTPEAPQMLGQFIARAIADHALPMNFLDRYKGKVDCDHARAALDRAAVLLSMKREIVRLDNVWGVGGGQRPVRHLIKEMNLLLKEYLVSGEVSEAEHCLRDLEVPHFHHELVYEAVVMVLESKGETAVQMMVKLLKVFWETGLITLDQMNRGFQRVYNELPDINLDVPHAHTIMETFVDLCFQESVITKQLRDACPSRGRKRFVSEGDGGRIKQ